MVVKTLKIKKFDSSEVNQTQLDQMIDLATRTSNISKEYIIERLRIYETVWWAEDDIGLTSFSIYVE
jgi:hypothetical protein